MVNGVLTIPLAGTSFDSSHAAPARAGRLPHFVAGLENALAATAMRPFLDRSSNLYSPLVLYGPTASGKSHLARGLADWWRQKFPSAAVECFSGREFVAEHAAACGSRNLDAWRERLGGCSLFILDCLDDVAGKQSAQEELAYLLDALADHGAQVVVTAAAPPGRDGGLLAALASRLSAGLAVPLAPPGRDARRAIIERLSAARGLPLSDEVVDELAEGLPGSASVLISAILELELQASIDAEPFDRPRVRKFIADRAPEKPTLRQIANLTARYFGLKVSDLKSASRRRSLVASRGVAMYLARELGRSTLDEIGAFFGGRDHATVLYGCRRTEEMLSRDRAIREAVAELKKLLGSP